MAQAGTDQIRSRQSCEYCTLPFCLHLAVMILGVVGVILGIVAAVLVTGNSEKYKANNGGHGAAIGSVIWVLLTTFFIFVSGLHGIIITICNGRGSSTKWHECFFVILALVVLFDLALLIVAMMVVSSAFWISYLIAVFAMELWVLCLRTCCKPTEVDMVGTELPIANPPGALNRDQLYSVDMSGQAYPPTYQDSAGLKSPYPDHL